MCQGFIQISVFFIILLATSSITVNEKILDNHLNTDCYVGSPWIALVEYSQMSTHVTGFQSHFSIFNQFVKAKSHPLSPPPPPPPPPPSLPPAPLIITVGECSYGLLQAVKLATSTQPDRARQALLDEMITHIQVQPTDNKVPVKP